MGPILEVFRSRKMLVILLLGFSSGIPLSLTGATLQAWMKTENVDLGVIGLFSLVGLPYALKFLWAPFMDRFVPPFLGRRKGWILITQLALMATISALALSSPKEMLGLTAFLALLVAFTSASQDIIVDAYRVDILEPQERSMGVANYILGYRVAMIVSGAITLILSDHMPWRSVYLLMALSIGIGILGMYLGPEPKAPSQAPKTIRDAVVLPFASFFKKPGALEILIFLIIYKLDIVFGIALTTPFMMDLGFTRTEIGAVNKGFGLTAALVGTMIGGVWMIKLGVKRGLWIFGVAQAASNLAFMLLAHLGHHYPMMISSIAIENVCSAMGNVAYQAFLLSICDKRFSATQYALFTSLMAVGRVLGAAPTGYIAKVSGWEMYFLISTLIAIPGLLLLTRYPKWKAHQSS